MWNNKINSKLTRSSSTYFLLAELGMQHQNIVIKINSRFYNRKNFSRY